jgi:hypothetical protein
MMDGVSTMETGNNAAPAAVERRGNCGSEILTSNYQAEYGRSSGPDQCRDQEAPTSPRPVLRPPRPDWNSNSWQNKANGNPKAVS